MAAFHHVTRAYEVLASDTISRSESSPQQFFDGIPIDAFKGVVRAYSWRFNGLKGIRKPKYPTEPLYYQDSHPNQEEFELDINIVLLILWYTFKSCHNSDLCSAQYLNPFPTSEPPIWTEKWNEKFDVPPELSLIDLSVVKNVENINSIKKLIGGCSCYCGGPFAQSNIVGERIPREMFIQFFLVTILREDSELFDLASVAIPQAPRINSTIENEFDDSKLSNFSASFLDPIESFNLDPPSNKRNPLLKRKSRRFFTAVTDVFQSPIVRPIYFNEGWRQCWLASRFMFRERPSNFVDDGKNHLYDIKWWMGELERIISSQEFDIITDALFATAMILFIGFFPSIGLMTVWILYAVTETCLRLYFKGPRR